MFISISRARPQLEAEWANKKRYWEQKNWIRKTFTQLLKKGILWATKKKLNQLQQHIGQQTAAAETERSQKMCIRFVAIKVNSIEK